MSFHTSECDRTIPDELSLHSVPFEEQDESRSGTSGSKSRTTSSMYEFRKPPGDEDDGPVRDDIPTAQDLAKMRLSPKLRKTPIPVEYLRTSVSPSAKQQFVRFENDLANELQADLMNRMSPIKSSQTQRKPPIDMRLRSNVVHIGGCWGSVDLSEAVDFKPKKRQDIRVINPIIAPGRHQDQRVVFRPSNGQDVDPQFPKYLV